MKLCVTCGKPITYTFWVCADCECEFGIDGVPYRNWPDWIKVLVRTSRKETRIDRREIAFSSLEKEGFDPLEDLPENRKLFVDNR